MDDFDRLRIAVDELKSEIIKMIKSDFEKAKSYMAQILEC